MAEVTMSEVKQVNMKIAYTGHFITAVIYLQSLQGSSPNVTSVLHPNSQDWKTLAHFLDIGSFLCFCYIYRNVYKCV